MDSKTDKIARLAFDPAAPEGEAIAAFLALRKIGGFLNEVKSPTPTYTKSHIEGKIKRSWSLQISANCYHSLIDGLNLWFNNQPLFTLVATKKREKLFDGHHLELTVWVDTVKDAKHFESFLDESIAEFRAFQEEQRRKAGQFR